jgi:hypothetical protein
MSAFQKTNPVHIIAAIVTILSTVSILTASVPLALVPAFLIVRPWTIITCSLVETSLIFAVINIPVFIVFFDLI